MCIYIYIYKYISDLVEYTITKLVAAVFDLPTALTPFQLFEALFGKEKLPPNVFLECHHVAWVFGCISSAPH